MKKDFYFGPHRVAATEWAIEKPKAIVQIVHGMIDHIGTYDEFAQFLNQAGYLVVGNDHMGHGATVSEAEEYGRFARDWTCLVEDVHDLHQEMKQRYPELPYFLMGHSMGSFITRAFLAKYGHEIDGAIIMSTGQLPLYQSRAAILIGHLIKCFKGGDYASPLLHYFSTGRLNHAYAPNKTDGDWLSRDEAAVARSLGDSKRQFVPSVNMSLGIFHLANLVAQQATIDKIPSALPLLLIAGDGDPLGNFGKGIRQLEERIARHHEGTLQTILYPGARHELLVETNKEEVMTDLLNWLNVTIQAENPTIQAAL